MDPAAITITAEPVNVERCKFVVGVPVYSGGLRRFTAPHEAHGSPLAEALFAIPGAEIQEIIVSGNLVTVVKASTLPWQVLGKQIGAAIRGALGGARSADAPPGGGGGASAASKMNPAPAPGPSSSADQHLPHPRFRRGRAPARRPADGRARAAQHLRGGAARRPADAGLPTPRARRRRCPPLRY